MHGSPRSHGILSGMPRRSKLTGAEAVEDGYHAHPGGRDVKTRRTNLRSATLAIIALLTAAGAPEPAAAAAIPSPATSNVRYDVTFDAVTAGRREIHVEMSFDVDAAGPVALSFPAWTPGSYEMDDYARNVRNVSARLGEAGIHWDKADYDTWRVHPAGAGRVTFAFDYHAE